MLEHVGFGYSSPTLADISTNCCSIVMLQAKMGIKGHIKKRVPQVDHGPFTPLLFSIYGSMGGECHKFYSRLSDLLSEKRNLPKSVVANWIRLKVCFALLKSSLLCLRGSRTVCRKTSELECEVDISHDLAKI